MVGRQAERERIGEILGPGCGAVVIEGAPGIGKTMLWREAVAHGRLRGQRVLSCEPGEPDAALPFAALGDLLADVPHERLADLPAPQRRALRAALYLEGAEAAPSDPQAVGRGLLGVLRPLAAAEPTLLAIDDAQWLDPASARVLAFALPRLLDVPVAIVIARRLESDETLVRELGRRLGDRLVTLTLDPLGLGEFRSLLAERLDRPPSGPVVRRIHGLSGGNPLYGLAIARRLTEVDEGDLPLPASLRDALADRLDRLDARAAPPLLAVAALRQATLPLLRAAVPGFALRDLDDAERAGIVAISGERVRFTHPLLASVHYARAGAGERRELHRRLATLVQDEEERGHHLALGADGPDEPTAAAIERAARAASARAAPEAAAELFTRAAHLTPVADRHAERALAAAELHHLTSDLARARAVVEPLLGTAVEGEIGARLYLLKARLCFEDLAQSRALLERAVARTGDEGRRAEIEFMLGEVHANLGDQAGAALHAGRAVDAAERAGDRGRLAVALAQAAVMALFRGEPIQTDLMDRAIALEPYVEGVLHFYLPTTGLGCQSLWTDDAATARRLLERVLRQSQEAGYEDSGGERFFLAHACWLTGDVAAARRYGAEFEVFAREVGDAQLDLYALYLRAMIAWREGQLDGVPAAAGAAASAAEEAGDAFVAAAAKVLWAQTELALGRAEEALERVVPVERQLRASGVGLVGFFALDAWACEAEALIATGRPAQDAIAEIERRGRHAGNPNAEAVAARLRGLAAAAGGDHAGAVEHFARALRLHERRPVPFEVGRTLLERGSVERRARRKAAAKQSLQAALDVLEPIEAGWWVARARDELGRVGLRRATPGGATAAQARVAELVAGGLTNREIAERLHMSVRTVEAHLTHIYRDHGVRSRTQLTAPPSLDPSLANGTEGAEALWVTNLPLLTYRHAEGEAGTQLIPALAQGLPAVSADGRTYMLVLRRGLRYSDGRPVRASDFTRAIERAIRLGSGYTSFFTTTIAGSAAFAARQARAISGIRTDDTSGRIVIHLVHPYGAFANLLAFPAAAPLPPGTPLRALPQAPPAGVGPYTLADIVPGHGFTLRRNRGFAGLHLPGIPTGHLTTVKVRVVANPAAETEEVLQNRADVLDASDAVAPGLLAQVRDKRGRFALTPEQETMYFFMDTRSRPFDSLAARQAVEYAVDRRALQRLASGFVTPSCYFVPPAVPGHAVAPCPYGLRPDLSRARRLLRASGRAGASVTVWGRATSPFAEFARYYAGVLASIGLKPTLRLLTDSVYYPTIGSAGTHAQTGYAEWVQDFPDPSDFYALLDARSIQPRNNLNLSRVDDPTIQRALLSLEAQTTVDARAWAALERHTAQQAYLVVIGQRSLPKFFSDRIDFRTAIISPVFLEDVSSWQLTDAAR